MNQSALPDKKKKWKVAFFTGKPYAGVAQKGTTSHGNSILLCSNSKSNRSRDCKKAVQKYHTDKYSRNLDTWSHLIVMSFCRFADCNSLRDLEHGMAGICRQLNHLGISKAPSRNALSHPNRKHCPEVFRYIYMALHKKLLGQHRFECRFKGNIKASRVKLLDSRTIPLCLKYFDQTHYSEEKGAIKSIRYSP